MNCGEKAFALLKTGFPVRLKGIIMFRSKRQEEILESTEKKLARMFEEFNAEKNPGDNGRLVCETRCTMARIRSFSDFMYLMRVKPLQTACYYGAAVFFLLTLAAVWCSEWLLTGIFAVIFFILATAPHNMRIHYFNKRADKLEDSFGKLISADFSGEESIVLTISSLPDEEKEDDSEEQESRAGGSAALHDSSAEVIELPYSSIAAAFECSHSFYIFPDNSAAKNNGADSGSHKTDAIICDKTQFICGTPMQLRDRLIKACGRHFKIKTKKA